ncbi:hypothetical protein KIN20_010976 [Parelaphostrongylus tenuis]|uniref:Uncharacterized protein n=1 Tax=Parelaphostrongylus tenuis TaxID=148309 RepID=A0AAD5MSW8_PARTN|nr:hypothetical protein KIN20_010976 [Parelaphostrongylus tenuis]
MNFAPSTPTSRTSRDRRPLEVGLEAVIEATEENPILTIKELSDGFDYGQA